MDFFVGMHNVYDAHRVDLACISINRLLDRVSAFEPPRKGWIMDSGAFTEIFNHGGYRHSPAEFVTNARRWLRIPKLLAVVSQDFMCEAVVLAKTGLSVREHQRMTIERYDEILGRWVEVAPAGPPIMPVLQGWTPDDYARHVNDYGDRLAPGMWVGVGSVCKRQGSPMLVEDVLRAILRERPDLRIHGFGVKVISLEYPPVRDRLHSADSMAWSFAARYEGRDQNDWREAAAYAARVDAELEGPWQPSLPWHDD